MFAAFSKPPYANHPAAKLGSPLRVVVTAFIIFILSQMTGAVLVESALALTGRDGFFNQSAIAQFLYILFAEGMVVLLVYYLLRRRKLSFKDIGLGRRPARRDLLWAMAGFAGFYAILIVATVVVSALVPGFDTNAPQDVGFHLLHTPSDQIIAFAALVILPPLGEETLMRGYLYTALRTRWRFVPAMLLTSILFGAAHLSTGASGALWAAGLDTFILSLVLVYVRERTGALYAAFAIHALNNLIAFLVQFH